MQVWMDQVSQWWSAAVSSGLATIAGMNLTTIGLTIKAWLGNVSTTKVVSSLSNDVAVMNDKIAPLNERLASIEAKLDALMTGVNGAFMATNIIGQNSSIAVNAKAELATLSAAVSPILLGKKAIENQLAEISNKVSAPIGDADKKLQAKKDELTKLATDQINQATSKLESAKDTFFDKLQNAASNAIESVKTSLNPNDKA